ncbi:MAG: hypothetical protein WKF30_12270 [Pyrinomonadaceae bacterium]
MSAPQFNQEAAKRARPVTPLPPTAVVESVKPRWRHTSRLLPVALIVSAAVIGAATGSIILSRHQTRVPQRQIAPTSSLTENQLNSPLEPSNEESARPEAAPAIAESRFVDVTAQEESLSEQGKAAPVPVTVTSSARDDDAPKELPRTAPNDHQVSRQERRQEVAAARPSASVESVAVDGGAVVAVRQRRTEHQAEESGQINHDEQKSQNREKSEGDAVAPPQDAREIRRVRELFEGRAKSRRQVDRVTAIFEGSQQR